MSKVQVPSGVACELSRSRLPEHRDLTRPTDPQPLPRPPEPHTRHEKFNWRPVVPIENGPPIRAAVFNQSSRDRKPRQIPEAQARLRSVSDSAFFWSRLSRLSFISALSSLVSSGLGAPEHRAACRQAEQPRERAEGESRDRSLKPKRGCGLSRSRLSAGLGCGSSTLLHFSGALSSRRRAQIADELFLATRQQVAS
jgi:hypothetical protein